MSGLTPFSINSSEHFKSSYQKIAKKKSDEYKRKIGDLISEIIANPYLAGCSLEPRPANMNLPDGWEFYKLRRKIDKGLIGQVRVMYLVNKELRIVNLMWIYNHDQFAGRPHDKDISNVAKDYFSE